ncbi:MAG: hypothetical protein ACLFQV_10500 [Vulcanimicrobiota bacterium]
MSTFEVNPSISTLLENARRADPAYGKKAREHKKPVKTRKSRLSSELSSDSSSLSEDMLGDMDPDEYRERDHTHEFKKRLKELHEESQRKKDLKVEEDEEEYAILDDEIEQEPDDEEFELEDEEEGNQEDTEREAQEHGAADGIELEEESDENIVEVEKLQEIKEKKQEKEKPVSPWDDIGSPWEEGTEEADEVELEKEPVAEKEEIPLQSSNDFISLLSYDEGYIIAEPKKASAVDEELMVNINNDLLNEKKEEKIIPPSLRVRYKEAFDSLVVKEEENSSFEMLTDYLKLFGLGVLETCVENDERLLLIPRNGKLGDYPGLLKQKYDPSVKNMRWGYLPLEKMVFIAEEVLTNIDPKVKVPILYFAFSFDHALGSEGFASEKSPAVLSNYNACKNREPGHQFLDSFSALSPIHYFAQSVEAYLSGFEPGVNAITARNFRGFNPREHLYDVDRAMHSYLEYLFKRINKNTEVEE